jgi:RNA ligase
MTQLFDLFDRAMFEQAQAAGHIRRQVHPTEPLAVLNYTEKAAYEGTWNPVTLACRGLIYNSDTMEVVARPFAKFFNHGQAGAAHIPLDAPVQVTDKADGSLAVFFQEPSTGKWAVATRGSFTSEQAIHATAMLRSDRFANLNLDPKFTFLAEIVYPSNRIVIDYHGLDDLILLGCVNIETGKTWGPNAYPAWWPGCRAEVFTYRTLAEALAAPARDNAEGFVIRDLATDARVKLKYEDYIKMHRIVTGLNARTVWEHLCDDKPLADLIAPLPDEFHAWVQQVADTITQTVDLQIAEAEKAHAEILANLPAGFGRGEYAGRAATYPLKWVLFTLLDGKDPRPKLLKHAKPEPGWNPAGRTFTEDNA